MNGKTMSPRKAVHFAVITDRANGRIIRIFNPDYEFELDLHHVADTEVMRRFKKDDFGIARHSNAMTPADVYRLMEVLP